MRRQKHIAPELNDFGFAVVDDTGVFLSSDLFGSVEAAAAFIKKNVPSPIKRQLCQIVGAKLILAAVPHVPAYRPFSRRGDIPPTDHDLTVGVAIDRATLAVS